jgi:hypothetical protein
MPRRAPSPGGTAAMAEPGRSALAQRIASTNNRLGHSTGGPLRRVAAAPRGWQKYAPPRAPQPLRFVSSAGRTGTRPPPPPSGMPGVGGVSVPMLGVLRLSGLGEVEKTFPGEGMRCGGSWPSPDVIAIEGSVGKQRGPSEKACQDRNRSRCDKPVHRAPGRTQPQELARRVKRVELDRRPASPGDCI